MGLENLFTVFDLPENEAINTYLGSQTLDSEKKTPFVVLNTQVPKGSSGRSIQLVEECEILFGAESVSFKLFGVVRVDQSMNFSCDTYRYGGDWTNTNGWFSFSIGDFNLCSFAVSPSTVSISICNNNST